MRSVVLQQPSAGAVQRSPFPITAVQLLWTGPAGGLHIGFVREKRSTVWTPVTPGCPCGGDRAAGPAASSRHQALVLGDESRVFELRHPQSIDVLSAVVVDTVHGPPRTGPASTGRPTDRGGAAAVEEPFRAFRSLDIVRRADWGAQETKATASRDFSPVQALTVHHTATPANDPDPVRTLRTIHELHAVHNGWGDIGYHFLVDPSGRIYEGRSSGTATPGHNAAGEIVGGFHTAGFNTGNIGIALLGTMTDRPPAAPALRSLTRLLAGLARAHGIDPQAGIMYANPVTGAASRILALDGHGGRTSTECPGARTDMELLRQAVADELGA
ncbi:N-acetylmuramoyl-L-alanine amidase [Streptomyces antibioticus]|uniref:N-acetylmuramoyl-L-alanine amidase n=1 Tax=Streptomyces antibioticus TaxID=1890 RepID=UPI0036DE411E